ncbi:MULTISPECIES: sensor histidine kinase [Anaeromyxobacter]|uniref:sensor histidine kinase n=1 Tax=Anaeromyxobacter TaxID=161492 RepID=UPI001F599433|nr:MULTISPECIES: ATP-binding protein [unclassified Anaeromyxobacter]
MNVAAAIAASAALVAVLAGALSRRLSLAPGWRDQHRFSLVAFSAAAYAVCNLATTLGLPDPIVTLTSRFQVASALVHFWAWFGYSETFAGLKPGRWQHAASRAFLLLAALALIPGVVFTYDVVSHEVPAFGAVYRDALPTTFGYAVFAVLLGASLVTWWRFVRAWRAGIRHAGVHAAAFGTLILFGLNDAFATTGRFPTPYLLDTGFIVPIVAVYWTITVRFSDNARALQSMRARLEELVDTRTHALAEAQAALHQSEKLAALGRFATAVAHEIRDPAAVITTNLRLLEDGLRRADGSGHEGRDAIADALAALERLGTLVRALADAGGAAAAEPGGRAVVADVVRASVSHARIRAGDRIRILEEIPAGLSVRARPESVAHVLGNLLANAADAVPEGRAGRVEVRAERRGGAVRITVSDDGAGMPPDVLRRAFEPFFSTKRDGRGRGLGLAISRGVVEGSGGALWLESEPGKGTRAVLELPELGG